MGLVDKKMGSGLLALSISAPVSELSSVILHYTPGIGL